MAEKRDGYLVIIGDVSRRTFDPARRKLSRQDIRTTVIRVGPETILTEAELTPIVWERGFTKQDLDAALEDYVITGRWLPEEYHDIDLREVAGVVVAPEQWNETTLGYIQATFWEGTLLFRIGEDGVAYPEDPASYGFNKSG